MSRAAKLFVKPYPEVPVPDVGNKEGFPAYSKSFKENYIQMCLTNTLGNTFYTNQKDLLKEANEYHKKMAVVDPVYMAKALAYARNVGFMRTQNILGLVYLSEAKMSKQLFEQTFNAVIRTPNDLSDFATMLSSVRKGQGGRRVRSTVAKWLTKKLNEYWIVKYGAEKKDGSYSIRDMIAAFHPKGLDSNYFNYVFDNHEKVDFEKVLMFGAFELLKKATTEDEKAKYIRNGKLPHEVASTFAGNSVKVWTSIVPNMPLFATLRNLATMEKHSIIDAFREHLKQKFANPEHIKKAKILPFRFLSAMEKVNTTWVKDILRKAVEDSVSSLPEIQGKTAILIDASGSMRNDYARIAFMLGISMFKKSNAEQVIVFSDIAYDITSKLSTVDSVLTQVDNWTFRPQQGYPLWGGTATDRAFLALKQQKIDNIILITDEQQNSGYPAYQAYTKWKQHNNRNAKLFVINVAPYTNCAICPADENNYGVYGWNDNVLSFIAAASKGFSKFVDEVDNYKFSPTPEMSESETNID